MWNIQRWRRLLAPSLMGLLAAGCGNASGFGIGTATQADTMPPGYGGYGGTGGGGTGGTGGSGGYPGGGCAPLPYNPSADLSDWPKTWVTPLGYTDANNQFHQTGTETFTVTPTINLSKGTDAQGCDTLSGVVGIRWDVDINGSDGSPPYGPGLSGDWSFADKDSGYVQWTIATTNGVVTATPVIANIKTTGNAANHIAHALTTIVSPTNSSDTDTYSWNLGGDAAWDWFHNWNSTDGWTVKGNQTNNGAMNGTDQSAVNDPIMDGDTNIGYHKADSKWDGHSGVHWQLVNSADGKHVYVTTGTALKTSTRDLHIVDQTNRPTATSPSHQYTWNEDGSTTRNYAQFDGQDPGSDATFFNPGWYTSSHDDAREPGWYIGEVKVVNGKQYQSNATGKFTEAHHGDHKYHKDNQGQIWGGDLRTDVETHSGDGDFNWNNVYFTTTYDQSAGGFVMRDCTLTGGGKVEVKDGSWKILAGANYGDSCSTDPPPPSKDDVDGGPIVTWNSYTEATSGFALATWWLMPMRNYGGFFVGLGGALLFASPPGWLTLGGWTLLSVGGAMLAASDFGHYYYTGEMDWSEVFKDVAEVAVAGKFGEEAEALNHGVEAVEKVSSLVGSLLRLP